MLKIFDAGLSCASRDDMEDLLACFDVLWADMLPVYLASVRLHIRYADWIGAVRILKRIEATQTLNPVSLALMADCLFKLGAYEWERYAATLTRGEANLRAEAILNMLVRGAANMPAAASRPLDAAQVDRLHAVRPVGGSKAAL